MLKLDRNGNREWEKFLGAADNSGGTAPVSVVKVIDGYVYAAFTTPASHVVIIKLHTAGTIVWRSQIDLYRRNSLGALAATSDGGLILAGSGDDDGLLMKIDSSSSIIWHKTYGKNSAGLFSVTADRDNGFIAAGGVSAGKAHLWILHTDNRRLPTKDQEITDRDFPTGMTVALTSDGGYAISAAGNLYAALAGTGPGKTLLFSGHMDRVVSGTGVKLWQEGEYFVSDGSTVPGADDVAGLAAVLEGVTAIREQGISAILSGGHD